jgi:predicted MPP superfamily phosphohydrolase
MGWFSALTGIGWLTSVATAAVIRSRRFAIFLGILLGIHSLVAIALAFYFRPILPVFAALNVAVFVNYVALARPRMRSLPYRLLVSWPAAFFAAGTLLAWPWAIVAAVGVHPWGAWMPYAIAGIGLGQSLTLRREKLDLVVRDPSAGHLGEPDASFAPTKPRPHPRGTAREDRPLRIVQITDPHLGPFMSVARLRRIAERAVAARPDLVLLTGDFLTMESQSSPALLEEALVPLRELPGRVFACMGNHDHEDEARDIVENAMAKNGIPLLVDEARVIDTPAGRVQIVGVDFVWRNREAHLAKVCAAHPREPGALRLVLLHDPGAFKHLPHGQGDLVLSGHTHGGQVGLVSLGLAWTFLRLFGERIPDHGFWARGEDRLYVHRGTGHYGFPLRLGVPAEESVISIHRAPSMT